MFISLLYLYFNNLILATLFICICTFLAIVWSFNGQYFQHENFVCQSTTRHHRASIPSSLLHLFIFALIYFYFICQRKSRLSPAAPQPRRVASTVNRKPCGIAAILSRMRVSTCTRRSYARRSKYGNAFTRNVFTGLSRNTKSAREASLTVYKQAWSL